MKFKNNLFSEEFTRITLDSDGIDSKSFCSSENMMVSKNGIVTRPGMRLSDTPIVFNPWEFGDGYTEFSLSDLYLDIDGKTARIAVSKEDDSYSNINYHICAVFSDGGLRDMGCITFTRADFYTFGVPVSYVIYSGKPTTGCGIYFLTRIVYGNLPDNYGVYELSEDMTRWHFVSDFYTPTVLMNGHGDSAVRAISTDEIKLSSERWLESANMLNKRAHCYYPTDGYSYSFTLPFALSGQSHIGCRLDINSDTFIEWDIAVGESESNAVSIEGAMVKIRCQRSLGRIFFETESGAFYVPAFYGSENNLRFTAESDSLSSALKVCSMSRMCTTTASVSGGSGSVTLFSGSALYPDELIWIDPEKPLYFPENCSLTISEPSSADARTVALDGRFLIFKKQNIFSAKVTSAAAYDLDGILRGISNSGKISYPSVSLDRQKNLPAPFFADTVAALGDSIFFYCKNGNVYKTNSALSLTSCFNSLSCEPRFAAVHDNKYIIFSDRDSYVYDPETSGRLGLYYWSFPISFIAAFTSETSSLFFAKDDDGLVYSFALDGEEDSYFTSNETPVKRKPIVSSLSLGLILSDRRCRLYSVSVNADTEKPFEFGLMCDDKTPQTVSLSENKSLIHSSAVFNRLSAEFSFSGRATLCDIGLKFAKLSKL